MKIIASQGYGKQQTVSLIEAIEGSIGSPLTEGQIETIRDELKDSIAMLAKLISFLYDNKCLTKEQIQSMFGFRYKIEE